MEDGMCRRPRESLRTHAYFGIVGDEEEARGWIYFWVPQESYGTELDVKSPEHALISALTLPSEDRPRR